MTGNMTQMGKNSEIAEDTHESSGELLERLEGIIGYRFKDRRLLGMAVTHCSLKTDRNFTYERMEFLGDAVVALVIAEHLYRSGRNYSEGEMTEIKSSVVSRKSLMHAGRRLKLDEFLRVDGGLAESRSVAGSLTSDAYEAVAGAVYLDAGLDTAREFVLRTLESELSAAAEADYAAGPKSALQERLQAVCGEEPQYSIVEETGPAHERLFKAQVHAMGMVRGYGCGRTKKEAEKRAAREALAALFPDAK